MLTALIAVIAVVTSFAIAAPEPAQQENIAQLLQV